MADQKEPMSEEMVRDMSEVWAARPPEGSPDRARFDRHFQNAYKAALESYDAPAESVGTLQQLATGALDVMDYGGGLVQTGLGQLAASTNKEGREKVKENFKQDWADAINPVDATLPRPLNEYADWAKIPEGPSTKVDVLGHEFNPSVRDAGIMATQVLARPSLAVKGLQRALGRTAAQQAEKQMLASEFRAALANSKDPTKLQKLGSFAADSLGNNPVSAVAERTGSGLYKQPFKVYDEAARDSGLKIVPSELAAQAKIAGKSDREIYEMLDKLVSKKSDAVSALKSQISPDLNMGGDEVLSTYQKGLADVENQIGAGAAAEARDRLAPDMKMFERGAAEPLIDAADEIPITSELADAQRRKFQNRSQIAGAYTPQGSAFKGNAVNNPKAVLENQGDVLVSKRLASKFREGLENMADATQPGLGGQIAKSNAEQQALLTGMEAARKKGLNRVNPWVSEGNRIGRSIGLGVGSGFLAHNPMLGAAVGATGFALSHPAVQSYGGLLLKNPWLLNAGIPAALSGVRNQAAPISRQKSPWQLLQRNLQDQGVQQ